MIKKNLQMMIRRVWLKKLIALYADAKRANQWGRGLRAKWGEFSAPVAVDITLFDRMEETWRYRLLLNSIKGREQVYREKVVAYDVFRDNKPWEPGALWTTDHDYLSSDLNPTREEFKAAFPAFESKKIYFSDLVDKMNPNGKMVERAIMLTDKGFFRMTPGKYKPEKKNELSDIKRISMTKKNDHLVILHHSDYRDSVINGRAIIGSVSKPKLRRTRSYSNLDGGKRRASLMLEDAPTIAPVRERSATVAMRGSRKSNNNNNNNSDEVVKQGDDEAERYSEFVSQILIAMKENGQPAPEVVFADAITVNVSKKQGERIEVTIKSEVSEEFLNSQFEKGKEKGEYIIYSSKLAN